MDMRKVMPVMVLVALWALPAATMAGWNPASTNACPTSQTIAGELAECSQPQAMNTSQMNDQNMMCPMVMPMQSTTTNGQTSLQPMKADQTMPQNAVMITILTPVSIVEVAGQQRLDANIDPSMANAVVLIPMTCNGQQTMQPMQLSPQANDIVLLIPLSPQTMTQTASMGMYMDGEMNSVPLNEQASSSGLAIENVEGKTKVMCPKD